jgi:hypothetical protein
MRKTAAIVILCVAVLLGGLFLLRGQIRDSYARWLRGPVPPAVSRSAALHEMPSINAGTNAQPLGSDGSNPQTAPTTDANLPPKLPATNSAIPSSYNLAVLFIPQAPKRIWDAVHEETCEEASMLMVQAYQNDVTAMTADDMDARLMAIVGYEKKTYGGDAWKDTDAQRTADIMRDFLGMNSVRVIPITSLDDVKNEIAQGRPVMLPASGILLKNPNFTDGGPNYHMVVAKGYTPTSIITNDPGTRVGADYAYKSDVLWNAIHDWNGGDVIHGAKVMIVVE